ncbi:unnamed protein product, partial [Discosporangium mesarthrocarpum]
QVRVTARSVAGYGPPSREVLLVTKAASPTGPPKAPIMVSATPSSITVGWVPPMYENGAPIIRYEIQRLILYNSHPDWDTAPDPHTSIGSSATATTPTEPETSTGKGSGEDAKASHTDRATPPEDDDMSSLGMASANGQGNMPSSSGPPPDLGHVGSGGGGGGGGTGGGGEGQSRNGGGEVGSNAGARREGGLKDQAKQVGVWFGMRTDRMTPYCTVGGLPNYCRAKVRVRAMNSVGWGEWSPISDPLKAQDVIVPVKTGAHYMVMRWFNKPDGNVALWEISRRVFKYGADFRGDEDDSWVVCSREIPGQNGGETIYRCTEGLTAGTEYQYRLRSKSRGEWQRHEEAAVSSPFKTACAPPEPPTQLRATQLDEDPLMVGGAVAGEGTLGGRGKGRGGGARSSGQVMEVGGGEGGIGSQGADQVDITGAYQRGDSRCKGRRRAKGETHERGKQEEEEESSQRGILVPPSRGRKGSLGGKPDGKRDVVEQKAEGSTSMLLEWDPGCPNGAVISGHEIWSIEEKERDRGGPGGLEMDELDKDTEGVEEGSRSTSDAKGEWELAAETRGTPMAVPDYFNPQNTAALIECSKVFQSVMYKACKIAWCCSPLFRSFFFFEALCSACLACEEACSAIAYPGGQKATIPHMPHHTRQTPDGVPPLAFTPALTPRATLYRFKVRSKNALGWGEFAPPTAPLVLNPLPPCSPPTLLRRGVTWLAVGLSPPPGSGLVLGFELKMCTWNKGMSAGDETWEVVGGVGSLVGMKRVGPGMDEDWVGGMYGGSGQGEGAPGIGDRGAALLTQQHVLWDLLPSTPYRFKVRAKTIFGWSPCSTPSRAFSTDRRF